MNFRRANLKDIEGGQKLFIGAPGVVPFGDDLEKFFDDNGFETLERSAVKEAQEAGRIVAPYVISDETEDRHGDTISMKGWELDHYNGTVLLNHGKAGAFGAIKETILPVADAIKTWKYGGQLKSVAAFTHRDVYEFGDLVGRMVKAGHIKGASVGFLPKEWEINEERSERNGKMAFDFHKQELTEWSVVSVGSNRSALVQMSAAFEEAKEAGLDTTPVVEEAEKILDSEPEEDIYEWAEDLFFGHKEGMNF